MEFRVLGPLEVMDGGMAVAIGGPKRRLLIAALLSEANRPLTDRDLLRHMHGDAGWDDARWSKVLHGLRVQIAALRTVLGQANGQHWPLVRTSAGYLLQVGPDDLDELVFLRWMEEAQRLLDAGHVMDAAEQIDRALGLWRGNPLANLEMRPFVLQYTRRVRELRLAAEGLRSAAYLAAGRHGQLVADLRKLVNDEPGREDLRLDLALALYRSGLREEAAEVCRHGLIRLREQGLDSTALQQRQREILTDDPGLRWQPPSGEDGALRVRRHPVPSQLPAGTGYFTGRDADSAQLVTLLDGEERESGAVAVAVAVVAIVGKAGVGKTTLAVHVAHRLRPRFPDGVLYVNLQATPNIRAEPALTLLSFLLELGLARERIPDDPEARAALYRSTLDGRRLLVVLDNAADEEQVRPLIPGAPSCAVIVTSRRALPGLDADHYVLDVLDEAGAVALLGKVAGAERVAAEPDEARRIADLCGCLPLAVRIAGALLAQRPATALRWLRERLEDERLNVLRVGDLEVRASVDLTYRELPDAARRAFRLLAVPETQYVSPLVAAALLDVGVREAEETLEGLADARLVERVADAGGEIRYRFHDLLRLFARERLAAEVSREEQSAALERVLETLLACTTKAAGLLHAGNVMVIPRRSTPGWQPPDPAALDAAVQAYNAWFDRERSNLVALVEQAGAAGFDEMAWLLSCALVDFFEVGAHWSDWRRTHETALAAAIRQGDRPAEANVRRHLGVMRRLRGDREGARKLLETSLELFVSERKPIGEAASRRNLGELDIEDGRADSAVDHLRRSRMLYHRHGLDFGHARTMHSLGGAYLAAGRLAEALSSLEAAVAILDARGNELAREQARMTLGDAYLRAGRVDDAIRLLKSVEKHLRSRGHQALQAEALLLLGDALSWRGLDDEAFSCYDSCLPVFEERRNRLKQARTLAHRGRMHAWRDEKLKAEASWRQALALFPHRGGTDEAEVRDWLARGPGARQDRSREGVLDHFDVDAFTRLVAASEYVVRILSSWTDLLGPDIRRRFLAGLARALRSGACVQILLLDPDSAGTDQRNRKIGGAVDMRDLVLDNLRHLRRFMAGLPEADRLRMEVRLYRVSPTVAYYRCDTRALAAALPLEGPSSQTTHYELPIDSTFAQFFESRFTELWTVATRVPT